MILFSQFISFIALLGISCWSLFGCFIVVYSCYALAGRIPLTESFWAFGYAVVGIAAGVGAWWVAPFTLAVAGS